MLNSVSHRSGVRFLLVMPAITVIAHAAFAGVLAVRVMPTAGAGYFSRHSNLSRSLFSTFGGTKPVTDPPWRTTARTSDELR